MVENFLLGERTKKIEWLSEFENAIDVMDEAREAISTISVLSSVTLDNMPSGSGEVNDLARKVSGLLSKTAKAFDVDGKVLKTAVSIMEAISELENPIERRVLTKRYLRMRTWERIGEEMGYSPRHLKRIHDAAIDHLVIPCQAA